ncbi:Alpha/Beta hydrolase protein [Aspergillus bertholletiae]|uniref:Alpha/Beta hydrolase protein n=1 Tax=Aspergillus bertholletiae TaxID=1226010 RepID=A0A5N7BK21_9EURO|nr:Alpha/Beta hydrolase protein [Aspergillus bertholletiae]
MTVPERPPFDRELEILLEPILPVLAQPGGLPLPKLEDVLPYGLSHEERTLLGPDGNQVIVSIFSQKQSKSRERPSIYFIHGGGMTSGNRFSTISWALQAVQEFDMVCVSIEYRLAPMHPDPEPIEDCYHGLLWTADQAKDLGIDLSRLLIAGTSAGGGLAAGVALLARDRGGPRILGQVLSCPMIDDRNNSVSVNQFAGVGVWDREQNLHGWNALLGECRGTDKVSIYVAPGRATDLSRLPPAFIDVGSTETFRDEDIQFPQQLWQNGVQCELHVWPGGFHAFDLLFPTAVLSLAACKARMEWMRRLLQM